MRQLVLQIMGSSELVMKAEHGSYRVTRVGKRLKGLCQIGDLVQLVELDLPEEKNMGVVTRERPAREK